MFLQIRQAVKRAGKLFKFNVLGLSGIKDRGDEVVVTNSIDDSILRLNVTIKDVFEDKYFLLTYFWNEKIFPLAFDHGYLHRYDGVAVRLESPLLEAAFRIVYDHALASQFLTLEDAVNKMISNVLTFEDEDYSLSVAILTYSLLYAMGLISFEMSNITIDRDISQLMHTFDRRKAGTLVIPKYWCSDNLFMWSVYAKELPLYEVLLSEDGVYHHPYIAVTDLRFKRIVHEPCKVTGDKVYFPSLNLVIEDPLLIATLNAYASVLREAGKRTYDAIESAWISKYGFERSVCSWLVSVLIGIGVFKIR